MTPVLQVDANEFERPEFQQALNQFARVYLAEGDSWLSYGSTKFRNVLGSLQLPVPACVLNISQPGDTLRRMHETTRNPQFYFYLRNKSGRRWNGIFLSGGGNDLIDAIWNERIQRSEILLQPPVPADIELSNLRSVINEAALADLLSYIKINVTQIVTQGRDQIGGDSNGAPLFMHTYALVQPRPAPVRFFGGGPWLHPACLWLGIKPELWLELARLLLEELAACLKSLNLPNFHVIDTLHLTTTLQPAEPNGRGNSRDWENEIHPNRGGYKKLAATWSAAIG
ncbi:MAG TPA: hypothetical protein VNA44_07955 [Burkholderiaceae bacterium]|nr:hypothetical protein [Burkholderiaceae bacterium]